MLTIFEWVACRGIYGAVQKLGQESWTNFCNCFFYFLMLIAVLCCWQNKLSCISKLHNVDKGNEILNTWGLAVHNNKDKFMMLAA